MQRRIFIGISLPEDVKKRINQRIEKWKELPICPHTNSGDNLSSANSKNIGVGITWSLPENFHITLSFLGFVGDESLADICLAIKKTAQNFESFDIDFEGIRLGPDPEDPRMVWLFGGASKELRKLQTEIEKSLDIFVSEKKEFKPHVTLGKIDRGKWKTLPEKPKIEERYKVSIPVESVDIFESKIEKGRTRYTVLESCKLK
ncbi:MAG: RNA 2',3'-cyclic phosphodiesterase [Patescibacteria group bacterium]